MLDILRGGQISIHYLRMYRQIIYLVLKIGIWTTLINIIYFAKKYITIYQFKLYYYHILSFYYVKTEKNDHKIEIVNSLNEKVEISAESIHIFTHENFIYVNSVILNSIQSSLNITSLVSLVIFIIFLIRGKIIKKDKHIRGASMCEPKKLKKLIKKYNNSLGCFSNYCLSNIPFPKDSEYTHTIVTGSSGTGKSTLISDLIQQIKNKGDRVVIYDGTGSYISKFFCPKNDIILNPLEERASGWNMFNEVSRETDLEQIANALIPDGKQSDPFWTSAARTVFSETCIGLIQDNKTNTKDILDHLMNSTPEKLYNFLTQKKLASSIINDESPKTAGSIISVIATYLKSFKHLNNDHNKFSIKEWVERDNTTSSLYIASRPDKHEHLKPLISLWMDIVVNSLLSKEENNKQKTWIILDELASLQKLPSLQRALAESRKFGGAFVLGLQSMPQLREIYGRDGAESISSLCRTRVVFASPDEDTARWCANSLGKAEVNEYREGISYGSHEMRDGVNIHVHKEHKNLVIPSQIMNLKNLMFYLKFPGEFPICLKKIKFKKYNKINEQFVEKNIVNFAIESEKQNNKNERKDDNDSLDHSNKKINSVYDLMDEFI